MKLNKIKTKGLNKSKNFGLKKLVMKLMQLFILKTRYKNIKITFLFSIKRIIIHLFSLSFPFSLPHISLYCLMSFPLSLLSRVQLPLLYLSSLSCFSLYLYFYLSFSSLSIISLSNLLFPSHASLFSLSSLSYISRPLSYLFFTFFLLHIFY